MSRIRSAIRRSIENPAVPLTSAALSDLLSGGQQTASGISVTTESALGMPAVWRAVNLISSVSASLPLKTYRKSTKDRAVVRLLDNPHPDKTQFELWEYAYTSVGLWGNSYQRKVRNESGIVSWLDPVPPSSVKVGRVKADEYTPDGKIFEVTLEDGGTIPLTSRDILHIPGFGYDGRVGCSPVRMARQTIGLGLALEQSGANLFGSGNLLSGILQTEQIIDDEQATRLKTRWRQANSGLSSAHDIAVLGAGASFQPITMPNSDAQFIESRRFQIAEVGRWFGLPGHFLGDTEKSTTWGTGIEHMSIGMVVYTLKPSWLTRFEQRITKEATPPGIYAEYDVRGLLQGDSAARGAYYQIMRGVGALNADDIRGFENMPPIPGGAGQSYLQPLNMAPLGSETDEPQQDPAEA